MPPIKPSPGLRNAFESNNSHDEESQEAAKARQEAHNRVNGKAVTILNKTAKTTRKREYRYYEYWGSDESVILEKQKTPWFDDPEQSNDAEKVSFRLKRTSDAGISADRFRTLLVVRLKSVGKKSKIGEVVAGFNAIDDSGRGGVTIGGRSIEPGTDGRFEDVEDTLNLMARQAVAEGLTTADDFMATEVFTAEDLGFDPTQAVGSAAVESALRN